MSDPCARIADWIREPDRAEPIDDDLIDHVEECPTCQRAVEADGDPITLWRRLAGHSTDAEVHAGAQARLDQRRAGNLRSAEAVTDVLMPRLPRAVHAAWRDLDPLAVCRATNAIASMLYNLADPDVEPRLTMTGLGEVMVDDVVAIPRASVEHDVRLSTATSLATREHPTPTGVMTRDQVTTFVEHLPAAARSVPCLFVGLVARPARTRDVELIVVERPDHVDLADYWRGGLDEPSLGPRGQPARLRGNPGALTTGSASLSAAATPPRLGGAGWLEALRPALGGGHHLALPKKPDDDV